ncbi:aryl-sulfate sulfotransferase [Franconibacter pulveris 601]|uniref:Arylsulfotransferase n=1 Tax=Franconibacter pulveris TaxID=435910 RepID=A0A0J8VM81_9ENTR|nr:aryl-sulfate sulfotransferase [Franconibacter pulveris]KMV33635.1 arylsulfotransferase [Franconibacter pulveris]
MTLHSTALPLPRPPINQGIDTTNSIVMKHNEIYSSLFTDINATHTQSNAILTLNPYGTAPLSLYIGLWSEKAETLYISVTDQNERAPVLTFTQQVAVGANLIPVAGLLADNINLITLVSSAGSTTWRVLTEPLPPTDAQDPAGHNLFPQVTLKVPASDPATLAQGLYFISCFDRNNIALDYQANVRWFTTKDMPSNNLLRIANGNFLSSAIAQDNYLQMYEFDMMGRVHTMYVLDNALHHSLWQRSDGSLVGASEYAPGTRPDGDTTIEDGVSIIDLRTGLETHYYDMTKVLDRTRPCRPSNPPSADGSVDWLHVNQCYINETNNILVTSGRNQSAIFGLEVETGQLRFIMSTHEAWSADYQPYLLTPVDASGAPLYDFSQPEEIKKANLEFWNWGQHNVLEIPNNTPGIIDISIFNNGNYLSRDDAQSIAPWNNQSRVGHYRIDLIKMTVQKLNEYFSGPEGYSSLCGAKQLMPNGNLVVCYGGATFDATGLTLTCDPGYSDVDYQSWDGSAEGKLPLRELTAQGEVLLEITIGSGLARRREDDPSMYRYNITCFRAYKLPLFG